MDLYKKGSEWRRWDLHVHTPGTKKNDRYTGKSIEEKWDNFYKAIWEYVGDGMDPLKNIVALGITDYLAIDNYQRVVSDKKLPQSIKLILPNVELRMTPIAKNSPINIHCIFAPEIADELESRFFSKLGFKYKDRVYSASKHDLIQLGKEYKGDKTLSKEVAYLEGLNQFVLDESSLSKVFNDDPELRQNTIIALANKSNDGASGVTSHLGYLEGGVSQLDATKRSIYQLADVIFSSNPNDVKYFLGNKSDNKETIIQNYGALKACIHGSDAHENKKIFEPDESRYCWIKANPTFNGLQQIKYEPEARVRISPLLPETKNDYQVIASVQINDDEFPSEPIYFNDKLTCIIGGKSTGKSLLLHNMANVIDCEQVSKKNETIQAKRKNISNMIVNWADGTSSELKKNDSEHKIIYVPQTYLNRLSDEQEEENEIDKIIHEIIILNADNKKAFEKMNLDLKERKLHIDKLIYDFVQQHSELEACRDAMKEIGTKEGIKKELVKLKLQKEKISKELNLTDDEIKTYDEAVVEITRLNSDIKKLTEDKNEIEKLSTVVTETQRNFRLSADNEELYNAAVKKALEAAAVSWKSEKEKILLGLKDKLKAMNTLKDQKEVIVSRLEPKISENEAVAKLSENIKNEGEKLVAFKAVEEEFKEKNNTYKEMLVKLSEVGGRYKTIHNNYAKAIENNQAAENDGLEFSVITKVRQDAFFNTINDSFDKRTLKNTVVLENTMENLEYLIDECMHEKVRIVKGKTKESVLRDILGDWHNTAYQVKMDNDSINEMSPGKKALVLLKMLINLAESRCPILIDQPEDDLDNRSIFDELIPFIRKKKMDRQIIIVTHNANVVLGGDAEEIIIANQDGKNSPNTKYRFEYCSGAIEDDQAISTDSMAGILEKKGIQEHICDILEGGERAFDLRKHKYKI